MKAIVAVDSEWGIGKNNDLLFHLRKDMAFFREKTLGKVVVMGSNTLLSFPNGKPLKDRTNIVLFPGGSRDDCIVAQSLTELSQILQAYDTNDVFIIGGAMFYKTMLPYCDTVYVTKVSANGGATHFYENLDKSENWYLADVIGREEDGGYSLEFTVYKNKAALNFSSEV